MRAIVCGGRDFTDRLKVFKVLDSLPITHVIEGGARGADWLARFWAQQRNIPYTTVNAEWAIYGKKAGYLRNKRMRDEFNPDCVIAFPGGIGTKMMVDLANEIGLSVFDYR